MAIELNIAKMSGRCDACQAELLPGEEVVATLTEGKEQFVRADLCLKCWQERYGRDAARADQEFLCLWRRRVPEPKETKKLFIDNELLVNFFERLAGAEEPARINFRFVLALVLMRKKLLTYGRSDTTDDGLEVWKMQLKHTGEVHEVINPQMDEEKIEDVSRQLGQILEGEL